MSEIHTGEQSHVVEKKIVQNPELRTQIETFKWLLENQDLLEKDQELSKYVDVGILYRTTDLLDANTLEINPNKKKIIFATEFIDQHCRMNGIDINKITGDVVGKRTLVTLTEAMVAFYGEEDPLYQWFQEFLDQSMTKYPEIYTSLVSNGGFWSVSMEAKNATERGGVEIKRSIAQILIEIANNQAKHGTETLPFLADAPDASQRGSYVADGIKFGHKVQDRSIDWLNSGGENDHLFDDISGPKTTDSLKYNPLIKILEGKCSFREYENLENLPIRLYREVNGGTEVEYLDVSANELLCMESVEIEDLLQNIDGHSVGREWTVLSEDPDLSKDAPIIGISIGGKPRPDSELYRHSHSGQSVIHLHYNTDRQRLDMAFSHVSFDGVPGFDWAFAVAESIDAFEESGSRGIEIDWHPHTQFGEFPDAENLAVLYQFALEGLSSGNFLDQEDIIRFIYSLEMSDVSISEEMSVEDYRVVQTAVKDINAVWYEPAKKRLEEIFAASETKGSTHISDEVKNNLLNRLLINKMTVTKFMDLVGRQFYGPEAGCIITRDPRTRVNTIEVKKMTEGFEQLIRSYPSRLSENPFAEVFDDKALIRTMKGSFMAFLNRDRVDSGRVKLEFLDAAKSMASEIGLAWLHNTTDLTAIKRTTAQFRGATEVASVMLNELMFEGAQIEFMTSHGGKSYRKNEAGEVVAVLTKFESAQTSMEEDRFAHAFSDVQILRDGKETLRYNDRVRLTTRTFDRLRMSNEKLMPAKIDKVARELSAGDPEKEDRIRRVAYMALKGCGETRKEMYTSKDSDFTISNTLVVLKFLSESAKGDIAIHNEILDGIQFLTIAGLVDMQEGYIATNVQVAKEVSRALTSTV